MAILKIQPFNPKAAKSGISISQGDSKGGPCFRIGITEEAQKEYFGRALDIEKDALALTVTDSRDHHHLMGIAVVPLEDGDGLQLSGGPHGSVGLRVAPWRATAGGKRPALSMVVVNRKVSGGGISVKLPEWARAEPSVSQVPRRTG